MIVGVTVIGVLTDQAEARVGSCRGHACKSVWIRSLIGTRIEILVHREEVIAMIARVPHCENIISAQLPLDFQSPLQRLGTQRLRWHRNERGRRKIHRSNGVLQLWERCSSAECCLKCVGRGCRDGGGGSRSASIDQPGSNQPRLEDIWGISPQVACESSSI